jgi:hypothetical protein
MTNLTIWSNAAIPIITQSDLGFLGNLIPLIFIFGISWGLSKKFRDIAIIAFPLALCMKIIFPFFDNTLLVLIFVFFIMNLVGSKGDLLADVKEVPKIYSSVKERTKDITNRALGKAPTFEDMQRALNKK